eukprot:5963098-Pleurochrysis_carterae.AAC.2
MEPESGLMKESARLLVLQKKEMARSMADILFIEKEVVSVAGILTKILEESSQTYGFFSGLGCRDLFRLA